MQVEVKLISIEYRLNQLRQDAVGNYNYTDSQGVTRTPIIYDTTQPQKVINEMRQLKPAVDKAFKSNQLLIKRCKKRY